MKYLRNNNDVIDLVSRIVAAVCDRRALLQNDALSAVIDRHYSCTLIGSLIYLAIIIFAQPATAQEASARAVIATNTVWVGEPLSVEVELSVPGYFDSAPSFDLPDPAGLLLLPPREHPSVRSTSIGGTNYTVQDYELTLFARQSGKQTIPSLAIQFQFKRNPLDKTSVAAVVKTESVDFTAKLPPGAENLGSIISVRDLKVTETWLPALGTTNIKAGDAFTRTITFSAPDVPGMVFPPFSASKVDGISIYPKPPQILDREGRSQFTGQRQDTIVYVCQTSGQFVIPPARLVWFDLEAQKLKTNELPARTFNVLANPALAGTTNSTNELLTVREKENIWPQSLFWETGVVFVLIVGAFITRSHWLQIVAPLRPVRLKPLNPMDKREVK